MTPIKRTAALVVLAVWPAGLGAAGAWPAGEETKKETAKTVTVLRDEDCGSPAIIRIKDLAAKLGLEVEVVEVLVTTPKQAEERRYLGSPTVQIGGLDIDPKARARTSFGLG